jgi:hypothetical protein
VKGLWRRAWQRVAGIDITTAEAVLVCAGLVLAVFLRLWQLNKFGFNSDEAVYSASGPATCLRACSPTSSAPARSSSPF